MQLPKVLAHRGASLYAPENTLAAFRLAREMGATWVEFDVELTQDGQAIVMHDATLERTTDGQGVVSEYPLASLQNLDAGSWFGNEYMGEVISTLSEVLTLLDELELRMNLEIKPNTEDHHTLTRQILQALETSWPKGNPLPLISSFDWKCLKAFKKRAPHFPLAILMHEWQEDWFATAKTLECVSVHVNQAILTEARVAEIKKLGYGILSYTVNDLARAETLWQWGVDGVFTDDLKIMPPAFLDPPEDDGEEREEDEDF